MSEDFDRGRRGEQANVTDWDAYQRGVRHQREVNAALARPSVGPVITGENPLLQGIVRVPFVVVGTLLYPVTALVSVIAALLCARLVPLFGPTATWERGLAYVPALVAFWLVMRWDQRLGLRNAAYRRARHVARLLVFALLGYAAAGWWGAVDGGTLTRRLAGAAIGAALGYWFLRSGDGWREFWHTTLETFRLRPAR